MNDFHAARLAELRWCLDWQNHKVTVPTGSCDGMTIDRFTIDDEYGADNVRMILHNQRPFPVGTYTRMYGDGHLWMSDSPDEISGHIPAIVAMHDMHRSDVRVLIHGLGIGMVVGAALKLSSVAHVDVVEIDPRVIALVAPHYERMAASFGKTLNVVHGSAFDPIWKRGTKWDVVWHDIWPDISPRNLPEMARLKRSFGHRTAWQKCWSERDCRRIVSGAYQRDHDRTVNRFLRSIGYTPEIEAQVRAMTASISGEA